MHAILSTRSERSPSWTASERRSTRSSTFRAHAKRCARNLLIEANPNSLPPQVVTAQREWLRRADRQTKALVNLFKGPDAIYDIADIVRRIETASSKFAFALYEARRALDRMAIMQGVTINAILALAARTSVLSCT